MSRRKSPSRSRRRRVFVFQTLEDRRVLAATTPDVVELTNTLGPNIYSGAFEQRSTVAPQYVTDAQGNRAIDLRVDVPGDQTVWFPSIGVSDAGPNAIEQSRPVARVMVRPNQRYVIEHRYNESGIPISAFNASGELIARLILATDPSNATDDKTSDLTGRYLAYIGDINWSDAPALRLPPNTASIVFAQGEITSIAFLDDFEGGSKTATWGSEPLYTSSKALDLVEADDPIPINGIKRYRLEATVRSVGASAPQSVGYTAYDRDGLLIEPQHVTRYLIAVDTTLARELKPGDTTIELTDATGWSNLSSDPHTRAFAWYGYRDANGNVYADYTYTRNVASAPGLGLWSVGGITGNRITLRQPWNGPTLASGTAVRNAVTGDPLYSVLADDVDLSPLSRFADISGFWRNGTPSNLSFPPATAIIRPAAELNHALTFTGTTRLSYRFHVAGENSKTVYQDGSSRNIQIDVLANDELLGDSPRITGVSAPKFGVVRIVNDISLGRQTLNYVSAPYFVGVDRFTYTVTNGAGVSFTEQVSISSLGSNLDSNFGLQVAIAETRATTADEIRWADSGGTVYHVFQGEELNVTGGSNPLLLEGLGARALPKFVSLERPPEHGSFKMEPNGAFRYIANAHYSGMDRIDLRVSNGVRSRIESVFILIGRTPVEVDQGKLGQIGGALESGESFFRRYFYPNDPAYFDASNKPFLSWRVHALPYLGFQNLYNQFRLNEPWNSPNNLPLASQMPDVYRSWGDLAGNLTRFQTIQAGQSSFAHWIDVNGAPRSSQANATHGEFNSILVLQTDAANAVIWTKPEDLVFTDPQSTLAKLTAPLFPAYFWRNSRVNFDAILVPQDIPASQFHSIAVINATSGAPGVDVATLARRWAERADTPLTADQYGIPKANYNIQALAIALDNYEAAYRLYPKSGTTSPTGQPLLSWRVQLLPFLGLNELYSRFKQDEPWDSPNNIALLNQMPDVFRSAFDSSTSITTRFRVVDGTDAAYDRTKTRIRSSDFFDGQSNTILFVEAGVDKAVPWTQPEAIAVDMSSIWPALGSFPDGFMRIGLADSSVGKLGVIAPNADIAALLTTGLRAPAVHAEEELYDALTLMERSGFPTPISARTNLRMLGWASSNFYDTYRVLPPNGYGALFNGTSPTVLLSWRVAVLPFLEANRLFSKFKLSEAWNSPNNLALMKFMPYYLRSVGDPVNTTNTTLQSFVGSNSFVNSANKKLRLSDLTKGPENTLAYVQTGIDKAVPWTKPADVNAEAPDIWKELGRVGQSARFSSVWQGYHLNRNLPANLFSRSLSQAVNINETYPRTVIPTDTLVIREGDFARVDLMMLGAGDVMEMDAQSFLTMTPTMTFVAAENITVDGTRKVQVRWGKRSNPADPTSPLILSQTLDVYVIDNEPLLLGAGPRIASENGDNVQFFVSRETAPTSSLAPDLTSPLTVTISSDSPNRIRLPSTVVIPAGQVFTVFNGTTIDNPDIEGPVTLQVVASAPGRLDSLAQVSIADDDSLQVRINPSTINERDGSTTGTITRLGGSLDQPLEVRLSSSNTGVAQVPRTIVIPAGIESASFTISAIRDASFDGVQVVRITAEVGDFQRSSASLTIHDVQPLQLQSTSSAISELGGRTPVVVFRSGVPLELPMVIQLLSSDTTELSVPANVTIPANEQSATFEATAVDDLLLDGTQTVTITAFSNAYDAGEVAISVNDYEYLELSFTESSISENGQSNVGRVRRSNTDTSQPLVVSLQSTIDPALQLPTSVVIPADASFVDFEARTIDDSLLNSLRFINVEAASAGYLTAAAQFRITDDEFLLLTVDRTTLSEVSEKTTARVTRSNTDLSQSLPVFLTWDSSAFVVNDSAALFIPAGSAFVDFTIETRDNHIATGTRQFTLKAEHPDYISSSVQIAVTDYEEISVRFEQQVVPESGHATQALLTRGDLHDLSQPLTVEIRTNLSGLVSAPTSVTIPAGSASIYFPVTTIDDDILTKGGKSVIFEAVHPAYISIAGELIIVDIERLTLEFDESQVSENGLARGRVVRHNTNIDEALTVQLLALTPGFFSTPVNVEIPAGSAFGVFTLEALDNATLNDSNIVYFVAENPYYQSSEGLIQVIGDEPLEFNLSAAEQFEGSSINATVTRNVDDVSQEAIVYIAMSDSTQLIAPEFITIPANERTATFVLEVPRDRIRDGDKKVQVEWHSAGFVTDKTEVNTLDLEALWHNPRSPLDVNDDGAVSPLDALLVINFLNTARGPVSQLVRPGLGPLFLDTSNDGNLSPLDALLVINHLNRRANGEGESPDSQASITAFDLALWQLEEEKLAGKRSVLKENAHLRGKIGFAALTK